MSTAQSETEQDSRTGDSFEAAYDRWFPAVLWYILSRVSVPQIAEDLCGDTFEAALRAWPTCQQQHEPGTWFLGIARNVVASYRRQRGHVPAEMGMVSDRIDQAQPTPEEAALRNELELELQAAIGRLSSRDRDLILLRYAADLPYEEIAAYLQVRQGTLRVRLHRILGRLRRHLSAEETAYVET